MLEGVCHMLTCRLGHSRVWTDPGGRERTGWGLWPALEGSPARVPLTMGMRWPHRRTNPFLFFFAIKSVGLICSS